MGIPVGMEFPWESHGNGNKFELWTGIGILSWELRIFLCVKKFPLLVTPAKASIQFSQGRLHSGVLCRQWACLQHRLSPAREKNLVIVYQRELSAFPTQQATRSDWWTKKLIDMKVNRHYDWWSTRIFRFVCVFYLLTYSFLPRDAYA